MSTKHSIAAERVNRNPEWVTRHDQTFWSVREKRDIQAHGLPEWEQLREAASQIKKHTVTHLADYLETFERNATANGAIVHWAKDADEYNSIVMQILRQHNVKKVVKGKSMLTEECHLNDNLIANGIDVVETDLGERILQLMHLAPSHIIMPAIHITREQVKETFQEKGILEANGQQGADSMGVADKTTLEEKADPTYLTRCARYHLRDNFMTAECGMTGANFGIASTGEIVVCTNEGNADMSTSVPKLHIASIGLEKIIPDYDAMGVFQRLLARHGTGQATTVFTSHFRKPRPGGEFHIILVDNGRSDILANEDHWQTLKCMRCGACMNTCPVYRRSGGYSYTYFIPGPIGINLGMLKDKDANYHNCSACSLCCSCDNVCPVKVDLSTQIYKWRQQLDSFHHADPIKKTMSNGMKMLFDHPSLYTTALRFAPLANTVPAFITGVKLNAWCKYHAMPVFAKESFHTLWKKGKIK
ncbi:MAG: LUD domain-containing protein [Prevotella sp.]|nr:LUD domain-containing protein [Prevotella sp.]MDY3965245.1 LUD domain-containing protein [Prevotella sp.]MDY4538109.1 LUD domain-containing protein [Prevotella sp.]MDY4990964.1 LUD domain-containing protein [Prevotella sp.]